MISKILVASDGSETAKKACQYAMEIAKGVGAEIILLTVIDQNLFGKPLVPVALSSTGIVESIEDYQKQAANAVLDDLESLCKEQGLLVRKVVRKGHPVEEIAKGAKALKADLIVLGSHGRSALEAAVLGSVAFGVSHKDAKIPVLIVRR